MSLGDSSEEDGSYERALVADDVRNRHTGILFGLIGAVAASLYFRTVHVYGLVAALVAWNLIWSFFGGRQTARLGYEVRGAAQSRGAVEWLICLVLLGAAFLIQSKFSLWFAQEPLCRRCT